MTAAPAEDRTADLQALADAGQPIPPGNWPFAGQLGVGPAPLIGSGLYRTNLIYTGPPQPSGAIRIRAGSYGYSVRDLNLINGASPRTGVGFGAGQDMDGSGTQSGNAIWTSVRAEGFDIGVKLGDDDGRACSDSTFDHLLLWDCRRGAELAGQNTLNLQFRQLGLVGCDDGLVCGGAASVHVTGGSATRVKNAVLTCTQGGVYSLKEFWAEESGRLATVGWTTATTAVSIEDCQTIGMVRNDDTDIEFNRGCSLTAKNLLLEGHVYYASADADPPVPQPGCYGYGSATLTNVRTKSDFLLTAAVWRRRIRVEVGNCALLDDQWQVKRRIAGTWDQLLGPIH